MPSQIARPFLESCQSIWADYAYYSNTSGRRSAANKDPTSFPGSLFSASIVVEKTTMEAEKRDPGNEVDKDLSRNGNFTFLIVHQV